MIIHASGTCSQLSWLTSVCGLTTWCTFPITATTPFATTWCLQAGIAGHVASDQYGRYGIIREADLATKVSEFQQWATEVKKVNIEALPKWEEKELFAEFMEDYNTGTLPHKKYYDLMAYAQQQAMKAAKKGRSSGVSLCHLALQGAWLPAMDTVACHLPNAMVQ